MMTWRTSVADTDMNLDTDMDLELEDTVTCRQTWSADTMTVNWWSDGGHLAE